MVSKKYDLGCSSRIPDPDADFLPSRIPDPGVKKAANPGSGSATLIGRGGPWNKLFGALKWQLCEKQVHKAQKVSIFRAHPSNDPCTGLAGIKNYYVPHHINNRYRALILKSWHKLSYFIIYNTYMPYITLTGACIVFIYVWEMGGYLSKAQSETTACVRMQYHTSPRP